MLACPSPLLSVCSTPWYPSPFACRWSLPCVPVLVRGRVSLLADRGGASPAPGASPFVPGLVFGPLGKAPAPKGGKVPPTTRPAGVSSLLLHLVSRPLLLVRVLVFSRLVPLRTFLGVKRTFGSARSFCLSARSLGPAQASLMDALALLSNVLSPIEVDRLRKLDPHPLPQPVESSNGQVAMELASKMQHQEQLNKTSGCPPTTCRRRGDKVIEAKGTAW